MKIANIDVPKESCVKMVSFPDFVAKVLDSFAKYHKSVNCQMPESSFNLCPLNLSLPLSPIRKFLRYNYFNIPILLHTIPIYLRKSRPIVKRDEEDIIDPLGAYFPNHNSNDSDPYIELYIDNIYESSENNEDNYRWLFAKVLIHELAHAAMDIFSRERFTGNQKVSYATQFGRWREESMANAITLYIIRAFKDNNFYNYAEQYMLGQAPEYALGVKMVDLPITAFGGVPREKENGVDLHLQCEWLKYAQGTPTPEGLQQWNVILSSSQVYEYNNRFYPETNFMRPAELALDIIMDYVSHNGPLSYSQLCAVFPNAVIDKRNLYCPLSTSVDEHYYFTETNQILHLTDGDYVILKRPWFTKYLVDIIDIARNNGSTIDIIKNYSSIRLKPIHLAINDCTIESYALILSEQISKI